MNECVIPVKEAARNFLDVLACVERERRPAILVRDGEPVATLNPLEHSAKTCAELAERWLTLEKLSPEEGASFADDVENSRANLPPVKPAWD